MPSNPDSDMTAHIRGPLQLMGATGPDAQPLPFHWNAEPTGYGGDADANARWSASASSAGRDRTPACFRRSKAPTLARHPLEIPGPSQPAAPMSFVASILESFGQALPPGSTVYVFAAQLPDGRSMTHAEAVPANGAALPRGASSLALAPQAAPAPRVRETPLDRVVALRTEHGADTPLKLRDWTTEIGIAIRELKRGIRHGALIAERKPDGRDNKALMITVGAMENYLRTVAAVERGEEDPPVWWTDVRGVRAAA